jgi:DNA-directed RNA polymerase specialized sigma subunit
MELFTSYNDLCEEIGLIEVQIEGMEKELQFWWVGGKGFELVPIDNAASRVDKLNERLDHYYKLLEIKRELRNNIDKRISKLEGLEYKVAYKRFIENKNLKEISDELGYSLNWIKKVSRKVKEGTFCTPMK